MKAFTKAYVAAALCGIAHGHMIMNTPTPYNYKTAPLVQVNPLRDSQLNLPFPCQGRSAIDEVTTMTAGQSQLVKFTGGAQHGGGSCQFSLTYEYPPPADKSKWKTIYTIIGGCPVDAVGNLPVQGTDQDGRADGPHCGNEDGKECIRQFNVPIPKEIPSGNATFAWTWLNKLGNREVYMTSAPVSITGGSSSTSFFDSLPPLFMANIPGECTTAPGVFNIPHPGNFGRVLQPPDAAAAGTCPAAEVPVFEADGAPAPPAAPPANQTESAPTATASTAVPTTLATSTRSTSSSNAAPLNPPQAPPATPPDSQPTAGSPSAGTVSCPTNGALVCIDTTHFGICNWGKAIPVPVAAGTVCIDGQIVQAAAR